MERHSSIDPTVVEREWNEILDWNPQRSAREAQRFIAHQPFLTAYTVAMLQDEGQVIVSFGLQLGLLLDRVYARTFRGNSRQVEEKDMDAAADAVEQRFSSLIGAQSDLALRNLLFTKDLACPGLVAELMRVTLQAADEEPALEESAGSLFLISFAAALAYEIAHGLAADDVPKSSLAKGLEEIAGQPLPTLGRDQLCPCGSGRTYSDCCAQVEPKLREPTPTEALFQEYLTDVQALWEFYQELDDQDPDVRWLRDQENNVERLFRPGQVGGLPPSFHFGWFLLDLATPSSGHTICELFLERLSDQTGEERRQRLQRLALSYPSFFEVLKPVAGRLRLAELVSKTIWTADHPLGLGDDDVGDLWFCRLIGPPDGALMLTEPLWHPADERGNLEAWLRELVSQESLSDLPLENRMRIGLKSAGEPLAQHVLALFSDDSSEDDSDDSEL